MDSRGFEAMAYLIVGGLLICLMLAIIVSQVIIPIVRPYLAYMK